MLSQLISEVLAPPASRHCDSKSFRSLVLCLHLVAVTPRLLRSVGWNRSTRCCQSPVSLCFSLGNVFCLFLPSHHLHTWQVLIALVRMIASPSHLPPSLPPAPILLFIQGKSRLSHRTPHPASPCAPSLISFKYYFYREHFRAQKSSASSVWLVRYPVTLSHPAI